MKKVVTLILSVLLVLSLFAGCNGSKPAPTTVPAADTQAPATQAPATQAPATQAPATQAPATKAPATQAPATQPPAANEPEPTETPEDDGGYHFAVGKFPTDSKGISTAPYAYDLPLTENDDVITIWTTTWSPAAIPEDGYGSMEYPRYLRKLTGVNAEYLIVSSDKRKENFAVLLASDDLADLSSGGVRFFTGTVNEAIEDGWFANIYDYKEYIPNYLYQATTRGDTTRSTIFYRENLIAAFYGLYETPLPAQGMMCRKDWANDLGINVNEVTTFDELHALLLGYQSLGVESPMTMYSTIERAVGYCFPGFNTTAFLPSGLPTARVNKGNVEFCLTTEDDRDLMTLVSTWFGEGLIDRNWASNSHNTDIQSALTTNKIGYATFTPGEIKDLELATDDPDVEWYSLPRLKKTEDQVLGFGQSITHFSVGSWAVNAKSENIPLLCTYADWLYSPEGYFTSSYGVPGYTYELDENGNVQLAEVILNNPQGLSASWAQMLYAMNPLADAGIEIQTRKYATPGGERYAAMHEIWIVKDYKGEYDYPSVKFTDEQTEELATYANDVGTYLNETYVAFVDGSKPMNEWDAYVQELESMGIGRCREIYQEAYETYLKNQNA